MTMNKTDAARLREPFPKSAIGKLPKGGVQLDYVGHAAVTDRLLAVDPDWSWEPFAVDQYGLPMLDGKGNLWIRLTVCGLTRIGVGDGPTAKVVIGDAIRNAAMRFGVALDLWSKEELEQSGGVGTETLRTAMTKTATGAAATTSVPLTASATSTPAPTDTGAPTEAQNGSEEPAINPKQLAKLQTLAGKLGLTRNERLHGLSTITGRTITTASDLTVTEARAAIDSLEAAWNERLAPTS